MISWFQLNIFLIAAHQWVRINHFSTSTTVEVDSDLKIPCSVEGYPIPTVDWYKDGELIQYNEQRQMIGTSECNCITTQKTVSYRLF